MTEQARTIFVDESAYSGSNFLDAEKPLFVVATLGIERDEAERLHAKYFSKVAATELKHSRLVRRPAQRAMVLDFLTEVGSRKGIAKVWAAEKRCAGWLKVVDHLIEPLWFERGRDLYADGGNVAMASTLYYLLPHEVGQTISDELLASSLAVLKPGTDIERSALALRLEGLGSLAGARAKRLLSLLHEPLKALPPSAFDELLPGALDMSLGAAVQLLAAWRTETGRQLRVVHDRTANMSRHKDVLDALTSATIDARVETSSSGMTLTYPVDARITFEPSDSNVGLQLTDVLAGAIGCSLDLRRDDEERAKYADAILHRMGAIDLHAVMPHRDTSPEAMGTKGVDFNSVVEHMAAQVTAGKVPIPTRHSKAKPDDE